MSTAHRRDLAFDIFVSQYNEPFAIQQLATSSSFLLSILRVPYWSFCNQHNLLPSLLTKLPQHQHHDTNDTAYWAAFYAEWSRVGAKFNSHRFYQDLDLGSDRRMLDILAQRVAQSDALTRLKHQQRQTTQDLHSLNTLHHLIMGVNVDAASVETVMHQMHQQCNGKNSSDNIKRKHRNRLFKKAKHIIGRASCECCSNIILNNLQFATPCQHRFCRQCFYTHITMSVNNTCPTCNKAVTNVRSTRSTVLVQHLWKQFVVPILRFSSAGPTYVPAQETKDNNVNGGGSTTKIQWDARGELDNAALIESTTLELSNTTKDLIATVNRNIEELTQRQGQIEIKRHMANTAKLAIEKQCDRRIGQLYRKRSLHFHPDRNNGIASPFWEALLQSYECLGTMKSRVCYERYSNHTEFLLEHKKQLRKQREDSERQRRGERARQRHGGTQRQTYRMLMGSAPGTGKKCDVLLRPRCLPRTKRWGWSVQVFVVNNSLLSDHGSRVIVEMKQTSAIATVPPDCKTAIEWVATAAVPTHATYHGWTILSVRANGTRTVPLHQGGQYSFRTYYVNEFGCGPPSPETMLIVEPPMSTMERNNWLTRCKHWVRMQETQTLKKQTTKMKAMKQKKIKRRQQQHRHVLVLALREVARARATLRTLLHNAVHGEAATVGKEEVVGKDNGSVETASFVVGRDKRHEGKQQLMHWLCVVEKLTKEYQYAVNLSNTTTAKHSTQNAQGDIKNAQEDTQKHAQGETKEVENPEVVDAPASECTNELLMHAIDVIDEFKDAMVNVLKINATQAIVQTEHQLYKHRVAAATRLVGHGSSTHRGFTAASIFEDWVGCRYRSTSGNGDPSNPPHDLLVVSIPLHNVLEELATRSCNEEPSEEDPEVINEQEESHVHALSEAFALWTRDASTNEGGDAYGMNVKSFATMFKEPAQMQTVDFELEHCNKEHVLWAILAKLASAEVSSSSSSSSSASSCSFSRTCPLCMATTGACTATATTEHRSSLSYSCVQQVAMECVAVEMLKATLKRAQRNPLCYIVDTVTPTALAKAAQANAKTVWNITKEEQEAAARKVVYEKNNIVCIHKWTAFDLFAAEYSSGAASGGAASGAASKNKMLKIWKKIPKWEKQEWKEKAKMKEAIVTTTSIVEGENGQQELVVVKSSGRKKKKKKKMGKGKDGGKKGGKGGGSGRGR